jgi:indolepyruvate decarboxylase
MPTVAEYLVTRLRQIGIEHVFTIPGDYAAPFIDALDLAKGIERVQNINELGCGYAADGYARFRGAGAACVQYGVGTFSLLNCVAGSFTEFVPVAIISSSPGATDRILEEEENILFHHCTGDLLADQKVMEHVTAASIVVTEARTAPAQIDAALTAMLTQRRPVYIEVIKSAWKLTCDAPEGKLAAEDLPSDADTTEAAVEAAWQRISAAERPVLFLGVEIHRFGLQALAQKLVGLSGLSFTTTSLAKTVLDESQTAFAGTYAGPASPDSTNNLMLESDCIVALGTIITDDYLAIMASSFSKMIRVSHGETRVGLTYYRGVQLKQFLTALIARFELHKRPAGIAAKPPLKPASHSTGLTYNTFYDALSAWLVAERLLGSSVLVLGESTSLYVFGNLFGLPADSFVSQAAWGSLGHETGSALGVALGSGKRPFVVAGDGGFMMVCQELSSMLLQKSNAVIFVLSNRAYAIEQAFVNLDAFKPDGEFAAYDLLPTWDYLALAQAFGAKGFSVSTVPELSGVLSALKNLTGQPALVEVVIPQKDLAPQLERLAQLPASQLKYSRSNLLFRKK